MRCTRVSKTEDQQQSCKYESYESVRLFEWWIDCFNCSDPIDVSKRRAVCEIG